MSVFAGKFEVLVGVSGSEGSREALNFRNRDFGDPEVDARKHRYDGSRNYGQYRHRDESIVVEKVSSSLSTL